MELAHGFTRGSILIDCTSGDPAISRRIAGRLRELGVEFIDAPSEWGCIRGARGDAHCHVWWRFTHFPVWSSHSSTLLASKVVLCGPVGCGHALKAVNNALLALHIWSTAEGLAILQKFGIDPAIALGLINTSSGRSNSSMNLFPERVLNRAFPKTFRLALLDKDVTIAARIAQETRTPAETIELAAKLFAEAHRELGSEADHVEAVKIVEHRAAILERQ